MKYRGKDINTGEIVEGDHAKVRRGLEQVHCIIHSGSEIMIYENGDEKIEYYSEVIPSSLAMGTTKLDKTGTEIFGSFPVDGVMSGGGDDVAGGNDYNELWKVVWSSQRPTFALRRYGMADVALHNTRDDLAIIPEQEQNNDK